MRNISPPGEFPMKILLIEDNVQNRSLATFLLGQRGRTGTSCAMAGDREKILAAGGAGYLEKPIHPETFGAEISRSLRPVQTGVTP